MFLFTQGVKKTTTNQMVDMKLAAGMLFVAELNRTVEVFRVTNSSVFGTGSLITTIDLSTYFTNEPESIVVGIGEIFVFESEAADAIYDGNFIKAYVRIDTSTLQVTDYVTLPLSFHCEPAFSSNVLWLVTPAPQSDTGTDTQRLYRWNVETESATNVSISANKQFEKIKIVWALDQYTCILSFNESSVIKFNDSNGSWVSTTLVDREVSSAYVNSDRDILISSHNGIVSVFDQDTDIDTQSYATSTPFRKIWEDTDHIWGINESYQLERVDKVQTGSPLAFEVAVMDGGTNDYSILDFNTLETMQHFVRVPSIQYWNTAGTSRITTPEYYVFGCDNDFFILRADSFVDTWDLVEQRNYYLTARGTTMVATGAQQYYGETE